MTTNIENLSMPTDAQVQNAINALESEGKPKTKKTAKKTAAPEGKICYMRTPKGVKFFRAEPVSDENTVVTEEWLAKNYGAKQINGFTADLLGVEKVGGDKDGKKPAISRFFKAAYDKLPLTAAAETKKDDKKPAKKASAKADKPAKSFVVTYDPTNEGQAAAFEQLAPQGKACVLAALGTSTPPREAKTVTVLAKELDAVLEKRRAVFGTAQPLKRIWGYHRPMLIAGSFLEVAGSKGGSRATDKYTYDFHFTPSAKNLEKFEALPPQGKACLLIALGRKKLTEDGDKLGREILGSDWRTRLFKAKSTGELPTSQNPFRIFQYHEHLLVEAGFLNVRS
jgi:hypothetical protein